MIRLSIRYLRLILMAVTALRKVKAVAANMYRHVKIGNRADMTLHDDLKRFEAMLQGLLLEARNAKSKTFTISIDSVVVGFGVHGVGGGAGSAVAYGDGDSAERGG